MEKLLRACARSNALPALKVLSFSMSSAAPGPNAQCGEQRPVSATLWLHLAMQSGDAVRVIGPTFLDSSPQKNYQNKNNINNKRATSLIIYLFII